MRTTYLSKAWPDAAYEIESDRSGSYTIRTGGKVVKRVTSVTHYLGKPRWGSRKLELNAIEDARAAIDGFRSAAG